ncbi:hypothetical protein [Sphingobacterium puteale]|uniref:hypothetical protein n=1 Tax=Sphingobacterium puteale TaxID=2420510 RepID=UPI003D975966
MELNKRNNKLKKYMFGFLDNIRRLKAKNPLIKEIWVEDLGAYLFKLNNRVFFLVDMEAGCISLACYDSCRPIIKARYPKLIFTHPYVSEKRLLSIFLPNQESSIKLALELFEAAQSVVGRKAS